MSTDRTLQGLFWLRYRKPNAHRPFKGMSPSICFADPLLTLGQYGGRSLCSILLLRSSVSTYTHSIRLTVDVSSSTRRAIHSSSSRHRRHSSVALLPVCPRSRTDTEHRTDALTQVPSCRHRYHGCRRTLVGGLADRSKMVRVQVCREKREAARRHRCDAGEFTCYCADHAADNLFPSSLWPKRNDRDPSTSEIRL